MPSHRLSLLTFASTLLALALSLVAACASLNHPDPLRRSLEVGRAHHHVTTPAVFRIATFNVHMKSPNRLVAAIVSEPQLRAADVIFLQEIEWPSGSQRSNAAEIARVLGMDHVYSPGYGLAGGGSHGNAILSRVPLTDLRALELPKRNTVVNSARRSVVAATIESAGQQIRLWNVHLDNRVNPKRRLSQLQPVLDAIAAEPYDKVVLAGDFNISPFCWIRSLVPVPCWLQARTIEKAVRKLGFETPTRRAGPTHRFIGMRLDAIFTRGLFATAVGVGDTTVSDHLPLWAALSPTPPH